MEKKLQKLYVTYRILFMMQELWEVIDQILSIIFIIL